MSSFPHFFGLSHKVLAEVVLSGALVIWALCYLMFQIVRATSLASRLACPECHSTDVSLSMRTTALDWPYRLIGCVPYRCQVCSTRYFCADGDSAAESVSSDTSSANTIGC
jgi:hypothetical protein